MRQPTTIQVVTLTVDELRAVMLEAVSAALASRPADPAPDGDQPLTIGEVAALTHSDRRLVKSAVMTGALTAMVHNPTAKGRAPRWLFDRSTALAWVRAGRPTRPD